jgi:NAD(P)-dependent dehydrogenase (short-subunit alcohol dehydrogenase family)
MTRGILLAGNDSMLFSALAAETNKRVEQYTEALIHNTSAANAVDSDSAKGRISIAWNPGSPISSRTMILSAENWLGQITDALLVCSPPAMYRPVEALVPAEIEAQINTQIKGWFFLIRELAIYFRAKGSGTLALIVPEPGSGGGRESMSDLFGAPAAASFRALAQGLVSSAAGEPFRIFGFSPETGQEQEFAAWLYKILDKGSRKNSGKWHKFSKLKLFCHREHSNQKE